MESGSTIQPGDFIQLKPVNYLAPIPDDSNMKGFVVTEDSRQIPFGIVTMTHPDNNTLTVLASGHYHSESLEERATRKLNEIYRKTILFDWKINPDKFENCGGAIP